MLVCQNRFEPYDKVTTVLCPTQYTFLTEVPDPTPSPSEGPFEPTVPTNNQEDDQSISATSVATSTPTTSVAAKPSPTTVLAPTRTAATTGVEATALPSAASQSAGNGSQGVAKGAVAGIAIAMLIVGAAIAFGIAFFLFRRRRPAPTLVYRDSTPDFDSTLSGKNAPYVQVSQMQAPPVLAAVIPEPKPDVNLSTLSHSSDFLADVLPAAADDHTVKSMVAALFHQIQLHVDNFYRDVHATITPTMERDLARFGSDNFNIVDTLKNSPYPTAGIKQALAGYILSIVSPEAEDQATLFPTEIAGLKQNERSTDSTDDQAAYILYRRLAVHLHCPTAASLQSRESDMREAVEHFAITFFPWANPAYHERDKDEQLMQIVRSALELSVWLYGQPYVYEYVWENVGRRGMVVAPGLARTTDTTGRTRERAEILLEPVTRQI